MKTVFVIIAFLSATAFGIWDPSWERPILSADLHEVEDQGTYELTLNQRDGSREPTSFLFVEDGKGTTFFKIVKKIPLGCGSHRYLAIEPRRRPRRLIVTDHTERLCDDYREYLWEATLINKRGQRRVFHGNPEPVITIQLMP